MENNDKIGKRVNFSEKNMLRLDILSSVYKKEIEGMSNRDSFDYIVNKVIEEFYKSDKMKKLLDIQFYASPYSLFNSKGSFTV